jgi:hypothetical protein
MIEFAVDAPSCVCGVPGWDLRDGGQSVAVAHARDAIHQAQEKQLN